MFRLLEDILVDLLPMELEQTQLLQHLSMWLV